jgi:hypothetical protein
MQPQAEQASRTGPQTLQYQSSPRRWKLRRRLPHPAQAGGEMFTAPTLRREIRRSATARGAGDRPSASTPGLSSSA